MNTDQTPTTAPDGPRSRGFNCCAIAAIVLLVLFGLGGMALTEFEKGIDGYGQLEGGLAGSVAEPLGAGTTARYEDGLKITVSRPKQEPDGSYGFTVTYDNGTDEEVRPGGAGPGSSVGTTGSAPLVVRAGKSLDDHTTVPALTWLNPDACAAALAPPLGKGRKLSVPVRVRPGTTGSPITVQVAPKSAGFRETAYWQFDLG
ncbi:hypothetical protein ACFVHB_08895 [Kitasatospora sp. NPDC127111]|uniref:hypothetical protein n=1 Tax=Kitasatospora sp. NPDC127111 TaxID=3345363 RepID=UPI003643DE6A